MFQTTNQNISIHCWSILTATEIPGLADWPKEESWPTRWLVGGWPTTLKNDGLRQLGWLFHSQWIWKVVKFHGSKPPTRWSIQVIFQKKWDSHRANLLQPGSGNRFNHRLLTRAPSGWFSPTPKNAKGLRVLGLVGVDFWIFFAKIYLVLHFCKFPPASMLNRFKPQTYRS